MLEPVHKAVPTTPGERLLSELAEEAFFGLWSYPSVHRRGGSAKQPVIKEVADLTVCFQDSLILISEKDKHFSSTATNEVAWQRWARESINDSVGQLLAAEKVIRRVEQPLFLDRRAERPFPLEIDRTAVRIHLVALCRNVKAAKRIRAPELIELSGEGLSFRAGADLASDPFVIGDVSEGKHFVHVFDEEAFDLVVRQLGTVADLLCYLDSREAAVRIHSIVAYSCEADLLASYLGNVDEQGWGQIGVVIGPHDDDARLYGEPWSTFINTHRYSHQWRSIQYSAKPWADIATRFSDAILAADVGVEAANESFLSHELALRLWASENLYSRAILAVQLFEKYQKVEVDRRSSRVVPSTCYSNRVYVFVFFPWLGTVHEDYSAYRHERLACMQAYAHAVTVKMPQFNEIVVLGAEPRGSERSSETLVALHVDAPPNAEQAEQIKRMMVELQVLTHLL